MENAFDTAYNYCPFQQQTWMVIQKTKVVFFKLFHKYDREKIVSMLNNLNKTDSALMQCYRRKFENTTFLRLSKCGRAVLQSNLF